MESNEQKEVLNEPKHLLKRSDPRLAYTLDEIFDIIKACEDDAMQEFVDDGRESSVIQMWVHLNMRLITDEQIKKIQLEYCSNGWKKVVVERYEERDIESLYICLYI